MGRKKKKKKIKVLKKKIEKKVNLPLKTSSADQKIEIKKDFRKVQTKYYKLFVANVDENFKFFFQFRIFVVVVIVIVQKTSSKYDSHEFCLPKHQNCVLV